MPLHYYRDTALVSINQMAGEGECEQGISHPQNYGISSKIPFDNLITLLQPSPPPPPPPTFLPIRRHGNNIVSPPHNFVPRFVILQFVILTLSDRAPKSLASCV